MKARAKQVLPAGYSAVDIFDISKDRMALLWLNLAALLVLIGAGWMAGSYIDQIRPGELAFSDLLEPAGALSTAGALVVMVIAHEGIHAALFWALAGAKARVGIGRYYAFACAPGWYIRRGEYALIGLGPLILLSLGGIWLVPRVEADWLPACAALLLMNLAGSVGDIYIVQRVWRKGSGILVEDFGEGFVVYDRSGRG